MSLAKHKLIVRNQIDLLQCKEVVYKAIIYERMKDDRERMELYLQFEHLAQDAERAAQKENESDGLPRDERQALINNRFEAMQALRGHADKVSPDHTKRLAEAMWRVRHA